MNFGIKICTALNMTIDRTLYFDRKNYFYPDLPKGYQITQQFRPIGKDGSVLITIDGEERRIGVEQAHLEEDTAKQIHLNDISLVNFNRCGTPLLEIVSRPDMHSGEEAMKYVEAIREIVTYLGVSDGKMEERFPALRHQRFLAPERRDETRDQVRMQEPQHHPEHPRRRGL